MRRVGKQPSSNKKWSEVKSRTYCYTCWRKVSLCLCEKITPFTTETKFSLLMHPMEAKRQRLGTGRLMKASIKGTSLFYDVNMDIDDNFQKSLNDPNKFNVLLYPAENPEFIDGDKIPDSWKGPLQIEKRALTLNLIDATWPMAKKMMRLSKTLQKMPKVSFCGDYQSRFTIKHQPNKKCLSTIETAFYCLEGLKKMGLEPHLHNQHQGLLKILEHLVKFQVNCEVDPTVRCSRGKKRNQHKKCLQKTKDELKFSRIREKKNRLFYWDIKKSPVGNNHNY